MSIWSLTDQKINDLILRVEILTDRYETTPTLNSYGLQQRELIEKRLCELSEQLQKLQISRIYEDE